MAPHDDPVSLDVTDLRRRLGQRLAIDIDLVLPELRVVSSRTTDEPVTGTLVVESIERGVSVTGTLAVPWAGECRRCLDEVRGVAEVPVLEIHQVGGAAPDPDADDDIVELVDDTIDLSDLVRDAALAALPLAPLCRDDCPGPDPERYPTSGEDEAAARRAAERGPDPRWSALADLDLDA